MAAKTLPMWVNLGVIPCVNLCLAFFASGLVILAVGENPVEAVQLLIFGAFGYGEAIGYTLFYTTNFIFTALGFAVAYHCGLFNIGAEGQAYIGGLGIGVVCLYLGDFSLAVVFPVAIVGGALLGGIWGIIPGYLQARRGSHIVITTIMLNFIASALMTYFLLGWLHKKGSQLPETEHFAESIWIPKFYELGKIFGIDIGRSPVNISLFLAILCCIGVWFFIWRTRWGYALRACGKNSNAAIYGGISPVKTIILAMAVSGALSGLMGINELMGVQHRLVVNFTNGFGFMGIAVALMGRNHPLGIFFASLLMGALYQGGAELAFEIPTMTRDMVVVIQGFVILFTGALEHMFRPQIEKAFFRWSNQRGT